jgi:iron(III) transport system permease protein
MTSVAKTRAKTAPVGGGRNVGVRIIAIVAVALLVPLTLLPLAFLVYGSTLNVESTTEPGVINFIHYAQLFASSDFWHGLIDSLSLGLAVGLGAGIIGVLLAWIMVHVQPPGRALFDVLLIVPFFLSSFVSAVAWAFLGNPSNGLINLWLRAIFGTNSSATFVNIYSFWGLAFVLVTSSVPFVYMLTSSALETTDVSLDEAAAMSGARRWRRLRTVTLPLVGPSIMAGVFFAVVFALEAFAEPTLIGGPVQFQTLTTNIYVALSNFPIKYSTASAIAVPLMIVTIGLVYFQTRLQGNRSFVALSGKSGSAASITSGYSKTAKRLLMIVPLVYVIITDLLPMYMLVQASLQPFVSPTITVLNFNNYLSVFGDQAAMKSILNSFIASIVGLVLSMVWMFVLAYVLHRGRFKGRRIATYVATLPIAVPGVVFGAALLWMWLRSPIPVYGTLGLVTIALLVRYSPYVFRSVSAAMEQFDIGLEESARMSGAGRIRVLWDVVFPLVRPALLSGAIIFAIFAFRDLNASVLLQGPNSTTFSVEIFQMWNDGRFPEVAASAVIQTLILLVLYVIARWVASASSKDRTSLPSRIRTQRAPKVAAQPRTEVPIES